MASTEDNLKAAFAGESQANRKYLAYAKKADEEGLPQVAKLFRAAAEAETVHALAHFKALGAVKATVENLDDAIAGESYENTEMYPPFIEQAEKDGHKDALRSFKYANEVEKVHEKLYRGAKAAVTSGKDLPPRKLYLCPICGNVEEDEPPATCPVCGVSGKMFKEIL